jgi:SAM-dependent methyltransferase
MPETGGIEATGEQQTPPEINTNVPQSARVYDYWLGGKDHFPADRALGEAIAEALPTIRTQVRAQRAFLGRAVRYLVRDAGVRQFLDIGTGIPSAGNVHDVAQEIVPESRVLYVDNDPIVLAHARALMGGTAEGRVAFIQADLREPEVILGDPAVPRTLDLAQPVGLVLVGVMHHLRDEDDPRRIVATLVDALAPGSYLVLSQSTPDFDPDAMRGLAAASEQGGIPNVPRSLADTEPFFADLELVEPGLVPMAAWRPDPDVDQDPRSVYAYGGVARKP